MIGIALGGLLTLGLDVTVLAAPFVLGVIRRADVNIQEVRYQDGMQPVILRPVGVVPLGGPGVVLIIAHRFGQT